MDRRLVAFVEGFDFLGNLSMADIREAQLIPTLTAYSEV